MAGLQDRLDCFSSTKELSEFLKQTPEAVNASPAYRPMFHYCQKGDDAIAFVKTLLEFGADPNLVNDKGQTPLQIAAIYGHEQLCAVLLEHGVHIDAVSAAAWGRLDILKELVLSNPESLSNLDSSSGCTPLQAAVFRNQADVIDFLLLNGADTTILDDEGHDCLWLAEHLGNSQILQQLTKKPLAGISTSTDEVSPVKKSLSMHPSSATEPGYKPF